MKKIILLLAVITTFLFYSTANAQTISRGSIIDQNNNRVAFFYLTEDATGYYWGCSSEFLKVDFAKNFYQIDAEKNLKIVAIKTASKNQQQILTIALTRLVINKKLSPSESYKKIFDYYLQNQYIPNWEYSLLHDI